MSSLIFSQNKKKCVKVSSAVVVISAFRVTLNSEFTPAENQCSNCSNKRESQKTRVKRRYDRAKANSQRQSIFLILHALPGIFANLQCPMIL